jgi:hypothetical protein
MYACMWACLLSRLPCRLCVCGVCMYVCLPLASHLQRRIMYYYTYICVHVCMLGWASLLSRLPCRLCVYVCVYICMYLFLHIFNVEFRPAPNFPYCVFLRGFHVENSSLCMCMCAYIHVYVRVYTCVCAHIYMCMCAYIHVYVRAYVCLHVCICMWMCVHEPVLVLFVFE